MADRLTDQSVGRPRPNGQGGFAGAIPDDVSITVNGKPLTASDGTVTVVNDDGSVSFGGAAQTEQKKPRQSGFHENLAEKLSDVALSQIAQDVLEGIDADEATRTEWLTTYTDCMDLLGLKVEGAPGEAAQGNKGTISKVQHPVLLESIILFQSAARAEMLPSDGPAKVKNVAEAIESSVAGIGHNGGPPMQPQGFGGAPDAPPADVAEGDLAKMFEADFNHYLTDIATEFYPDTDRGHFYLGYGGTVFKKLYHCPLRKRPVSECVYMPDLIVSNDVTDLQNALRVTHRIRMMKSTMRRMQLNGAYRDVELVMPTTSVQDRAKQKEGQVSGHRKDPPRPKDAPYDVLECYTELDLAEHGHVEKGAPDGLPLPYRVTIERESREVLEVRRDWKQGDKEFRRKKHFVKYGLVPGFGFYDIGFLHMLGNSSRALTAVWRILIDAGMFGSFPGGLRAKGSRTVTNEIMPSVGEFQEIDIGALDDVRKAVMPFPYQPPSPVLLEMGQVVAQDARKIGQAVNIEVGEGRTNVPVGTIMAMIEQQTQTMQAIHKRMHTAQSEELRLLRDLFLEDPESLTRLARDPKRAKWTAEEFQDLDLVPASDPNIPAQIHRIMQCVGVMQIAEQYPQGFKIPKLLKRILSTINFPDPEEILVSEQEAAQQQQGTDPKVQEQMLKNQNTQMQGQIAAQKIQGAAADAQSKLLESQREGQSDALKIASDLRGKQLDSVEQGLDRQNEANIERMKAQVALHKEAMGHAHEQHQAAQDRQHEAGLAQQSQQHEAGLAQQTQQHEAGLAQMGQQHEAGMAQAGRVHEAGMEQQSLAHEAGMAQQDQEHEAGIEAARQEHDSQEGFAGRQHEAGLAAQKPPKKES